MRWKTGKHESRPETGIGRQAKPKPTVGERSVRIIAGQWRGRRIPFIPVPGLRPTPDRVRETLFNWLQRAVVDCRCLDLYAGTGALGFEALSRGAAQTVFVEREPQVVGNLNAVARTLGATGAQVVQADAEAYLRGPAVPFDLVFLDPPFALGALSDLCTLLETRGWLAPTATIYLEQAARDAVPELPTEWRLIKETRAGEVRALLAQRGGVANE